MPRQLSTRDVSRILGMPEGRIRELVRAGLCAPDRQGRRYAFTFQDVVVLRAAKGLIDAGVPPVRVRRALVALRAELLPDRPLSGVRVRADGRRVAVLDGGAAWEPDTGQTLLAFDVDDLAAEARALDAAVPQRSEPSLDEVEARASFEAAVSLDGIDDGRARALYRHAVERDPGLVDAWVNLGRLTHDAGDAREAVRLYQTALERDGSDPVIHFNHALALEDAKGPEAALGAYERALELDPEFADAHYNLAGLLEALGRPAEALGHYRDYKRLTDG
jgi:tetratricopeptide (TPR) repeat protein